MRTSLERVLTKIGWMVAVAAALFAARHEAQAQAHIVYPWCTSGAMQEYGAINCGFWTLEQCLQTARGNGQACGPNPFYVPPPARQGTAAKRHRHLKRTSR